MTTQSLLPLIVDAKTALDTIANSPSAAFRKGAAEWLQSIAEQIQADLRVNHPAPHQSSLKPTN